MGYVRCDRSQEGINKDKIEKMFLKSDRLDLK